MPESGFLISKKVALMFVARTNQRLGSGQDIYFNVWSKNIPDIRFWARS